MENKQEQRFLFNQMVVTLASTIGGIGMGFVILGKLFGFFVLPLWAVILSPVWVLAIAFLAVYSLIFGFAWLLAALLGLIASVLTKIKRGKK